MKSHEIVDFISERFSTLSVDRKALIFLQLAACYQHLESTLVYIYNTPQILSFYCPQTSFIHNHKTALLRIASLLERNDYLGAGTVNPTREFEDYLKGDVQGKEIAN